MAERLFIVDGHAYAYRAFYAIRLLNSPGGKPTNAIYGFIKMLAKMRAYLQPSHLIVVWDGGLAAERMELLPEYKTHRPAMPSSLETQLDEIVRYLEASNIASYHREGIEADDWIATLTRRSVAKNLPVVIASADKDFFQLVSPMVGLLNPNDKEARIWTREEVCTKTGVCPEQIVEWLSLIGDSVDNIPGVPGIGPTTAANLLKQFGSIDNLFGRLDEVKSLRHRENLRVAEEVVRRNLKMIRLYDDMQDEIQWEKLTVQTPQREKLMECYAEWGFKTLLQELQAATEVQRNLEL